MGSLGKKYISGCHFSCHSQKIRITSFPLYSKKVMSESDLETTGGGGWMHNRTASWGSKLSDSHDFWLCASVGIPDFDRFFTVYRLNIYCSIGSTRGPKKEVSLRCPRLNLNGSAWLSLQGPV